MVRFPRRVHCGCAILPPQMLRRIAARGTAPQRDAALETLATDQTMRLVARNSRAPRGAFAAWAAERSDGRQAAHRLRCPESRRRFPDCPCAPKVHRRSRTPRRTRRTMALGRRSISSRASTTATRSMTRDCTSTPLSITVAATTMRSGTDSRWYSAMATATSSTASPSRSTSSRTSSRMASPATRRGSSTSVRPAR